MIGGDELPTIFSARHREPSQRRSGLLADFSQQRIALIVLLACILCAWNASPSQARWSRTRLVFEPASCAFGPPPALDAHGHRWVACELGSPPALWVGRANT